MARAKITKGGVTLRQVYRWSKQLYYKSFDDKAVRMRLDITKAKVIARQHYEYDANAKEWVQVKGLRHTKFEFLVSSKPVSYKRTDNVPIHKYPVIFLFYNLDLGWNSPFRWRTGSFKKVLFATKGSIAEKRQKIGDQNIRNGRQLDFFFKLEALLRFYGLLYGPDTTNRKLPLKANPLLIPYFDKTALFVVEKILRYLFTDKGIALIKNRVFKNE